MTEAIDAASEEAEPDSVLAAQVREARRVVRRVSRVPESLARELAEAQTLGHEAWCRAREAVDFALFEEVLAQLIRLKREEATLIAGDEGRPYDALLDAFEPGTTEEELLPLFATLREELTPIVRAVSEAGKEIDETPARGDFSADAQLAFGRQIAERMGFDFGSGRIDLAPHPFCSGRRILYLLVAGIGCLALGWLWGLQFPIIKKLWTSSYVLFAGRRAEPASER